MGGDLGALGYKFFVSSLMVAIQMHIQMFKLVTLAKAYSLACLQELVTEASLNPTCQIPTPLFP